MDSILICVRATAPWTTRGSRFDRRCGTCGECVMVSPSGQKVLKRRALPILCTQCYLKVAKPEDTGEWAAKPEEMALELANRIPNFYRRRN